MQSSERLVSLDAFRGATIAAMILANNAGSFRTVYEPLRHVPWHGWTFTDCIMPSFLWIVGVAMTFSFAKRMERGDSKRAILLHSAKRGAIIFALGLFLYLFPSFDFAHMRIPGVLQRIGVCYFFAAAIFLGFSWRGVLGWALGFLAAYWLMMTLIPVPGYGPGVLTPMGNFAGYVDRLFLQDHMWRPDNDWDPEGILSTIPSISTMLFGVLAGYFLRRKGESRQDKTGWMFLSGIGLFALGLFLDHLMPINKMIWTVSFCILMAGVSTSVFTCFYWLMDVQAIRSWAKPAIVFGMNSIAIYMFASLLETAFIEFRLVPIAGEWITPHRFMESYVLGQFLNPYNVSLVYAALMVLVAYVLALAMYRRNWFIRI
jgi:predicted acyltransferase